MGDSRSHNSPTFQYNNKAVDIAKRKSKLVFLEEEVVTNAGALKGWKKKPSHNASKKKNHQRENARLWLI